jgi:DNA-binding beta-propeller fold protein YncE
MRRRGALALAVMTAVIALGQRPLAKETGERAAKGGIDATGPYRVVDHWFKPLHDRREQCVVSVFAEDPNRIYVLSEVEVADTFPPGSCKSQRTAPGAHCHFILVLDGAGRVVDEWSQWRGLFGSPHAVKVNPYDAQRHVWIVNEDGNQVYEFTHDGRQLVMTLGERDVAGADDRHFSRPTDVAFLPDGTFVVSDGSNARIVKFDARGRVLASWGTKGSGPGQFQEPHGLSIDRARRIYVADRDNDRIQVFDEHGRYLDQWPGIVGVVSVLATSDDTVWALSGVANRVLQYDAEGHLLTYWGAANAPNMFPGSLFAPHAFSVDSAGSLYIADYRNHRLQKFVPNPAAGRTRLIGQPAR